jgi:hypothetical protein
VGVSGRPTPGATTTGAVTQGGAVPGTTSSVTGLEAPVVLTGTGTATTRSFPLRGGSYSLIWTATAPTSATDNFAAFLRPAEASNLHTQVIATVLVAGGRSQSGQTQATNLPAGTYFIEIVGGTSWSISISAAQAP